MSANSDCLICDSLDAESIMGTVKNALGDRGIDFEALCECGTPGDETLERPKVKVVCVAPNLGASVKGMGGRPRDQVVMVRVDTKTAQALDAWSKRAPSRAAPRPPRSSSAKASPFERASWIVSRRPCMTFTPPASGCVGRHGTRWVWLAPTSRLTARRIRETSGRSRRRHTRINRHCPRARPGSTSPDKRSPGRDSQGVVSAQSAWACAWVATRSVSDAVI